MTNSDVMEASQTVTVKSSGPDGYAQTSDFETATREGDSLWRSLASICQDPVIVCTSGMVSFANPGAIRLLASGSVSCVLNNPLNRWILDVNPEKFDEEIESIAQGTEFGTRELRLRTNSGDTRTVVATATPVIFQGRRSAQIVMQDITPRLQVEREMVTVLEQQQQRFGRELHDGVGQLLTAVQILSGNLVDRFFSAGQEGAGIAEKVARYAREASVRVREIQTGLSPFYLNRDGLAAALQEFADDVDVLPGPDCTFTYDGQADVKAEELKLHLYRIAQESVNNSLKHAQASKIRVALYREERDLVLQIEDNGKGLQISKRRSAKSLGLNSMYYRARAIGGRLDLLSSEVEAGKGTVVRCTIQNYFRD